MAEPKIEIKTTIRHEKEVKIESWPYETVSCTQRLGQEKPHTFTPEGLTLTFTPDNWNVSQWVTVTGRDDGSASPIVPYRVVASPAP